MRAQFSRAAVQLNRKVTAWGQNGGWWISFLRTQQSLTEKIKGTLDLLRLAVPFERTANGDLCVTQQVWSCMHMQSSTAGVRRRERTGSRETQWRAVIAPCKRFSRPLFFALARSTHNRSGLTHEAHFRKWWPNCEKIHSSKKQEVVSSCVKPEHTSLIVTLRNTLTRCNLSHLEMLWEDRWDWIQFLDEIVLPHEKICPCT